MKWMLSGLLLCAVLSLGVSYAATIEPQLQQTLQTASPSEKFPVNFVMVQQGDPLALDANIENLPKPQRRARVGRVLMDFTEATQRDLIKALETRATDGQVDGISPLWIVNMVGCWATRDVIYEMAARPDVRDVLYGKHAVDLGTVDLKNIPVAPRDGIEPNIDIIHARGAWKQGYTGQGVVVGLVDTGMRYTHLDLANHLWTSTVYPHPGFNFASTQYPPGGGGGNPQPSSYDTLTPLDYYGHGTHCAGLATGDGAYGNGTRDTVGVAPSAKIMAAAVDVYLYTPFPDTQMENNTMAGFQFCVRPPRDTLNGCDVISTSLGLITSWLPSYAVWRICERNILLAGIPHMVAAGNEASSGIRTPGNCPPPWRNPVNHPTGSGHLGDTCCTAVITVGATKTTSGDPIAVFSSLGPTTVWGTISPFFDYESPGYLMDPDISAPGDGPTDYSGVFSTYYSSDQAYTTMAGTSMATPTSAGCVALMLSKNPNISPKKIDSILELYGCDDKGTPGKDNTYGAGRINCSLAVAFTPPPITNDVGVKSILSPVGLIDSNTAIAPTCSIYNYGSAAANYPVRMKVGSFYNLTATVTGHPSYTYLVVPFPTYSAWPRGGPYAVSCSTEMVVDENRANDKKTGTMSVQVRDVATTVLMSPTGSVDSNATVTPACSVYNYGSIAATFDVRMKIGTLYDNTASVTVAPLTAGYATFAGWLALERGNLAVACSTGWSQDHNPANDKLGGSVFVRVADVGVTALPDIPLNVDSNSTFTPKATIHNYGDVESFFDVFFTIEGEYTNTIHKGVAPLADSTFSFADWTAHVRGTHAIKCSTMLTGDMVTANDWTTGSVTVSVHDVGVVNILAPSGSISPGPIAPRFTVHNYGTLREPVAIVFRISPAAYLRSIVYGNGLPIGADTIITFPSWTATGGSYTACCSTYLPTDQVHANDVLRQNFSCGNIDIAVTQIVAPVGSMLPGSVTPQAKVKNLGDASVDATITFEIAKGGVNCYRDTSVAVGVAPGAEVAVSFDPLTVDTGSYTTLAKNLTPDGNPANDVQTGSFVVSTAAAGWAQKADVPLGSKSKKVKDGGALAYDEETDATGYIYAFKGNNRCEFYKYNIADNTWAAKESIPAVGASGKKKAVKKGAAMADGHNVRLNDSLLYAAKGNNCLEFWQYNPNATDAYPWSQKTDVPTGAKNVKEGAGMVPIRLNDSLLVYLLKGSGTQEFYQYNTISNVWAPMANAPLGLSNKTWKNGSCLAASDDGYTIYALKGSYNEFFSYSCSTNTWTTHAPLPLIGSMGKKKKVKDGAGIAYLPGKVYGLKGGNTYEFWTWAMDSDRWTQKEDMPIGGGKRVKGGGALVRAGSALYAFKGNNTSEFYVYNPSALAGFASSNGDVMSNSTFDAPRSTLRITPNPFTGQTTIYYSLAKAGDVSLRLYDVAGQLVQTLANGYHPAGTSSFIVHRSSLSCGIYVLRFDGDGTTTTHKLILE